MIVSYKENRNRVPFPSMPLGELKKLLNYQQNASNKQVKTATLLSTNKAEIGDKYINRIK